MKRTFNLKSHQVVVDDDYIYYKNKKLSRATICNWGYEASLCNGSGNASIYVKADEGEIKIIISINSIIFLHKKSDEAIEEASQFIKIIVTNKACENFIKASANEINKNGYFKYCGVTFTKTHVKCGFFSPLEVQYKNASINHSKWTTTHRSQMEVYLNDGQLDKEKKIADHLSGTDIQKLNLLVEYLPHFLN
jgi:hypothetical protein